MGMLDKNGKNVSENTNTLKSGTPVSGEVHNKGLLLSLLSLFNLLFKKLVLVVFLNKKTR